jgi:hypothetical protein
MLKKFAITFTPFAFVSACNGDSSTESEQPTLVGTWNLTTLRVGGVVVNPDEHNDVPVKLTFSADGTGSVWISDYGLLESSPEEFIWETQGNQLTVQFSGQTAETVSYSLSGNALTVDFWSSGDVGTYTRQT